MFWCCDIFDTFRGLEKENGSTTIAVDIQSAFVGGICRFVLGNCVNMNLKKHEMSKKFLEILVIVCKTFRDIDGPKARDDLSSFAVRLLKEHFAVF